MGEAKTFERDDFHLMKEMNVGYTEMQLREPLPTQHEQILLVIGFQNRTMFLDSLFLPTIMFALHISLTLLFLTTAFVPTFVLV